MYMFPPFFAYYAANANDATLLGQTVTQIELYRAALKKSSGAWAHIEGANPDAGEWSTGNGWAAMGMTRVLKAALKGPFASSIKSEYSSKLTGWIKEILDGAISSSVRVESQFEDPLHECEVSNFEIESFERAFTQLPRQHQYFR